MARSLVLALCVGAALGASAAGQPPAAADLERLIEQLGSPKFAEREAASRQLAALDEVPAALQKATGSPTLEVARRAKEAVKQIQRGAQERKVRQMLADVNRRGLDAFIDQMALTKGFATEDS